MKINLDRLSAYELKQERALSDIHSEGLYFVHKKSGARICVLSNADENKVFYIAFRTTPKDNTGVAHIIEHTVLCGSEKFPLKDPFIELLKGSMNTFLNAITYPDKTMYPVASCNDKDFQNLMDVYMDSVFHPNIYKEEKIFKQEGWHYELNAPEDDLIYNGVVYNEMKGAYSSSDEVLESEITKALFPDTTYSKDSGGDPEAIPTLTYENYLDFHRTYYHPSNSYIYLYGNMDVEEKLEWLDREYLSAYDRIKVNSEIGLQKPFDKPVVRETEYSISSAESEEDNTYLSYNWVIGTNLDREQYIAFDLLDYALLSSQGSPIKKALTEAGIGEDIYGGYDSSIYQPMFHVIAKGANLSDEKAFLEIIQKTLKEQADGGLNKKTLLATLNGYEFKFRESDYGRTPKGLMLGIQMMDSWLYDDDQPFLHMDELQVYQSLREKIDTDYFEQLIRKYLLNNTHSAIVRCVPKKGLNAKRDAALQEKLNAYRDSLNPVEIDRMIRETAELEAYQEEPSSKEDLEKIPLLSREDMKQKTDPFCNIEEVQDGVTYLCHDYDTNGVVYLDFLFDAHHIAQEDLPYLGLLRSLLGKMDTSGYSYADFSDEVNMYTGGVSPDFNCFVNYNQKGKYEVYFEIRMKTLVSNLKKCVELAAEMALHTDFSDEKRLWDLLNQMKSRKQDELSDKGSVISLNRAVSYFSKSAYIADQISGIAYCDKLTDFTENFSEKKAAIVEKLQNLVKELFQTNNVLVNCTSEKKYFQEIQKESNVFLSKLYPATEHKREEITLPAKKNEGFMDASQIQYVSMAGTFANAGLPFTGAFHVFKTIMNYDYLWNNVRVKGGAYGCGCNVGRGGEVAFYSYRDPNLGRSLDVYRGTADYLHNFDIDERTMTKYVIGTFSELDTPVYPMTKGRRSLTAWLTETSYETVQREREQVLNITQEDIRDLEKYLRAADEDEYICAIGNEEKLKEESALFTDLRPLI